MPEINGGVDEDRMRLLVSGLKSGQYAQAKGVLTRVDEDGVVQGHCCLGVACEVAIANGLTLHKQVATESELESAVDLNESTIRDILDDFGSCVAYEGHAGDMPRSVSGWYGLGHEDCDTGDVTLEVPPAVYDKYRQTLFDHGVPPERGKAQATFVNDTVRMTLPDIGECFQYTFLREDWEADHAKS